MTKEISSDLLFEGEVSLYRQVDLKAWGDVSNLISFDSDLKSLGFILLGDLLCSAVALGIIRAYMNKDQTTRAVLPVAVKDGALNVFGVFFHSKFGDGAVATTTTSPAVKNKPADGIHRKICAWRGVYELYRQHEAHLNELKSLHGQTEPMGNTLLSVAQSIDAFSVRMSE
jgi:hypothetical protein